MKAKARNGHATIITCVTPPCACIFFMGLRMLRLLRLVGSVDYACYDCYDWSGASPRPPLGGSPLAGTTPLPAHASFLWDYACYDCTYALYNLARYRPAARVLFVKYALEYWINIIHQEPGAYGYLGKCEPKLKCTVDPGTVQLNNGLVKPGDW